MDERTVWTEELNQGHRLFHGARYVGYFSNQVEIIWSGKTVEKAKKGIINESFSNGRKHTEYEWFPKAEHIKWILPF